MICTCVGLKLHAHSHGTETQDVTCHFWLILTTMCVCVRVTQLVDTGRRRWEPANIQIL